MKVARISPERRIEVAEIDEPGVTHGTVKVRVERCGICGTDLVARTSPNPRWAVGSVLGHEIVGTVVEIGEGVSGWKEGDRVALYHGSPCGACEMCTSGRDYLCLDHLDAALGHGVAQGGYAEHIVVGPNLLHRIPDGLSFDQAGITEPLAIAFHGVNKSTAKAGDAVCILGAGPIGAMTAAALKARGVTDIVFVDPNPARRALVAASGYHAVDLAAVKEKGPAALGERQPTAIFECTGHVEAAGLAVDLIAYNGRIILQGVPKAPVLISQYSIVQKEVEIVGSASCTQEEMEEAIGHLAAGRVRAEDIVTAVVPLDEADAMFDALLDPAGDQLKVLIAPNMLRA
jgi:2-desacetyl-2-hydroxyethyl bacteriochlorophyllide A dehydrogenase